MRHYLKILGLGLFLGFGLLAGPAIPRANAQAYPYYYPAQNYYPSPVVVQPLLLPRTGSNDYLYQYDNVYGAGASAAGRMDRVVNNPYPQLFYPRQPRVYIGY